MVTIQFQVVTLKGSRKEVGSATRAETWTKRLLEALRQDLLAAFLLTARRGCFELVEQASTLKQNAPGWKRGGGGLRKGATEPKLNDMGMNP